MDDSAVVTALVGRHRLFFVHDDDADAGMAFAQGAGHAEADEAGSDYADVVGQPILLRPPRTGGADYPRRLLVLSLTAQWKSVEG